MSKLTNDIANILAPSKNLYGQVISISNGIANIATKNGLRTYPTVSGLKTGDNVMIKNGTLFPVIPAKIYYV